MQTMLNHQWSVPLYYALHTGARYVNIIQVSAILSTRTLLTSTGHHILPPITGQLKHITADRYHWSSTLAQPYMLPMQQERP
jgi:glycerol-3-phosphate dehydrogenase